VLGYPISWFFVPPAEVPSFKFPKRMVPVPELADGPLLGGAAENMLRALVEEQVAILNDAVRRTQALTAITHTKTLAATVPFGPNIDVKPRFAETTDEEGKTR
jgi:hypothetical protein